MEQVGTSRAQNPHCIPWHLSVRQSERSSNTPAVQPTSKALLCNQPVAQPSTAGFALAASQQREDGTTGIPLLQTEDNTPSLKVWEAHANKSGKSNAGDCQVHGLYPIIPLQRELSCCHSLATQESSLFYDSLSAFRCGWRSEVLCGPLED